MNKDLKLKIGCKYTTITISRVIAMTYKTEITITSTTSATSPESELLSYVYREKCKRTERYLDLGTGFIFEGWGIPFGVDTDKCAGRVIIRGNACFNFTGNPEIIKDWLDNRNLNPEADKAISLLVNTHDDGVEILYPLLAEKSSHAVIQAMIAKRGREGLV